ncbi:MAG: DUF4399 domain-containing protein [Pseudomonadota bacterium]|uniref:DUF4399 domain-containing protein n=1 Tax=Alcanivorax sp. TaxID=1872427 RepID=UPI00243C180B|nr:DUF4399 domain-containing protein [Alcanivorax sp.]MED5239213.1 DUF4399 domain-containing protein [Pseudomonadota bacterium]MEE3321864.1 DUF4399 domain-containing protein [Pseudomonadota bacterium]
MRIPFQRSVLVALVASTTLLQACSEQQEPASDDNQAMKADATEQHAAHDAAAPEGNGITRSSAPEGAKVFFVAPQDGATVTSPVTIEFGVEGMDVVPAGTEQDNSGHHHLLIDLDEKPAMDMPLPATEHVVHFGKGQTSTTLELEPGEHTLQLLLGDWRHIPHDPAVLSQEITITVE